MSDHIRAVGPHVHAWADVHYAGPARFQECRHCGTRRITDWQGASAGPMPPWMGEWVEGGPIEEPQPEPKSEPKSERLKVPVEPEPRRKGK